MELTVRGDEVGLLRLEQGIEDEESEKQRRSGGMYDNQVVKHGFDTQAKSKDALNRI
jgi:hypothetical protein